MPGTTWVVWRSRRDGGATSSSHHQQPPEGTKRFRSVLAKSRRSRCQQRTEARGQARRRSGDLPLFRRSLCQLSYLTEMTHLSARALGLEKTVSYRAVPTRFELATSALTGRRELLTSPRDLLVFPLREDTLTSGGERSHGSRDIHVMHATELILSVEMFVFRTGVAVQITPAMRRTSDWDITGPTTTTGTPLSTRGTVEMMKSMSDRSSVCS